MSKDKQTMDAIASFLTNELGLETPEAPADIVARAEAELSKNLTDVTETMASEASLMDSFYDALASQVK